MNTVELAVGDVIKLKRHFVVFKVSSKENHNGESWLTNWVNGEAGDVLVVLHVRRYHYAGEQINETKLLSSKLRCVVYLRQKDKFLSKDIEVLS